MSQALGDDLELELAFGELVRSGEEDADRTIDAADPLPQMAQNANARKRSARSPHILGRVWFWYCTVAGDRYREFHLE